ncbi:thiol reductant ABC exporter subunit CydC [Cellulomonas alba]|uniref:Thiol reductant ABC exporter subunit CydC n=1 Tax=Cellulomonas alba TaxID=3053467 RepID=A0ABT7SEI2_9CELL|nr:thiol reductant ABC exporter subunit CydC [Cellulomonas alba]MDM7853949.1 thiol reductant ABC exporter subunit CydC [Cellulomonas alba]
MTAPVPAAVPPLTLAPPRGTLRRAVALLEVDRRRAVEAVLLGALALGCSVALAAVAAWLIARASQMPPVLQLSVATVAVRAFGIGRGVLRYVERLVSHDLALRGMTTLRTSLYERLAAGAPAATLGLRRGDLLARVGADVDAIGDVVVRGLLPAGVAAVLGAGTSLAMGLLWPPAGFALAACLLLAGVVAPLLAARGARDAEHAALGARADAQAVALGVLEDAGPLAVAGRLRGELGALRAADVRVARATDRGAASSALAAAVGQLAVGLAVVAALVTGVPAVADGRLAAVTLAVVVLTPLAAFEATALLPAAAVQVQRSRAAAGRVLALLDAAADDPAAGGTTGVGGRREGGATSDIAGPGGDGPRDTHTASGSRTADDRVPAPTGGPRLVARGLAAGWPAREPAVAGVELELVPGRSLAIVGPSGAGKTTLLLTLAGLLPRHGGVLELDGTDIAHLDRSTVVAAVVASPEDAHVFGTTVLENLRVARGDVTPDEARAVLGRVGLDDWLAGLPDGVDTPIGPDARTVSGGERRRLLVARALLSPAPLLLLDEPAEHLDPDAADRLVTDLLSAAADGRGTVVVTHRLAPLGAADEVLWLSPGATRRGTHATLLATHADYREAVRREGAVAEGQDVAHR